MCLQTEGSHPIMVCARVHGEETGGEFCVSLAAHQQWYLLLVQGNGTTNLKH